VAASESNYKKKYEVPRYRRIKDELRRRVADGYWAVGQVLPSRNILTAEFGSTRVTLDKAIQQLVDEGVLTSSRGSGTRVVAAPGQVGQGRSANGKSSRIAVVFGSYIPEYIGQSACDIDDVYFGPVLSGLNTGFAGQQVEVRYARVWPKDYLTYFRDEQLDGLIIFTAAVADFPHLHALIDARVPFVTIGVSSSHPNDAIIPTTDASNRGGGADAARHLLKLGHRRIGCVNLSTPHANHMDRLTGFEEAMEAAGFPVDSDLLCLNARYAPETFDEILDEWLERISGSGKMPTAIFACDFEMTLTTLSALRRRYLTVPNDVSLVGFDDPVSAAHLSPPLTTIRQPVYAIGLHAANRLLSALLAAEGPNLVVGPEFLDTEIVIRGSTCPPR
jgi:DNA-binding LacI/PurR family transcriptional regulator